MQRVTIVDRARERTSRDLINVVLDERTASRVRGGEGSGLTGTQGGPQTRLMSTNI